MDDELLKRIAKQIAALSIRVQVLQSELILLRGKDHEWIDRQVEDQMLSEDGRYVYEATLLALRGR